MPRLNNLLPTFSHDQTIIMPRLSQLTTKIKSIYCQHPAKIQETSCQDETNLPPGLGLGLTQYTANIQPRLKLHMVSVVCVMTVDTPHTLLYDYILHICCQVHFTAATFHCQQFTCVKGFCYGWEQDTGKVVLAFITSA